MIMKSRAFFCRFFFLSALVINLSVLCTPTLFAQVTINSGGFTSTTVCASTTSIPSGCVVATNNNAMAVTGALQLTASTSNQVGSAWAVTPQTVLNGFSTSFTFQFMNPSTPPADGIAFVIQNAPGGLTAIGYTGGNGGAIGYGDDDNNSSPNSGIPNSLAIELDSYQNGWDLDANHVAVQSCGTLNNTSHHEQLCTNSGPNSTLGRTQGSLPVTFSDGKMHTVIIQYNPPGTPCSGASGGNLCIYLDQTTNPNPVLDVNADLSTIGLTSAGAAYVGFTGATGGSFETQNILSWTFAPTTVVQPFNPNGPTTSNFSTPQGENQQTFDTSTGQNGLTCLGSDGESQPCTSVQLLTTNNTVPNASTGSGSPTWPQYVVGTPWAISQCAARPGNGGTGNLCSLFVNACFGGNVPQSQASDIYCPFVQSGTPESYITLMDTWDPITPKPPIPAGTTVSLIDFVPTGTTDFWTAAPLSQTTPNGACLSPFGATSGSGSTYNCQLSDTLVDMYGDQTTTRGSKPKKGWLISVFEVPMNLTSVDVVKAMNCTSPHSPLNDVTTTDANFENPAYAANIWNNGNCLLDFVVNPGAIPPSYTGSVNFYQPAPTATFVYGQGPLATDSDVTVNNTAGLGSAATWDTKVNLPLLTTFGRDGTFIIHWSATDNVGITERNIQLLQAPTAAFPTCPNLTNDGNPVVPSSTTPCYATSLFTTVVNVDSTFPTINGVLSAPGSPAGTFYQGQMVNVTYTCNDPYNNNVASGISMCAGSSVPTIGGACPTSPLPVVVALNTSATGPQSLIETAVDCAGNTTSNTINYIVAPNDNLQINTIPLLTLSTGIPGIIPVTFGAAVTNLSTAIADDVTVTTTFSSLPSGVVLGTPTATISTVTCTNSPCTLKGITVTTTSCSVSWPTVTCSVPTLGAVSSKTGLWMEIIVPVAKNSKTGKFTSTSVVKSAGMDPTPGNNTVTQTYTIF
jgi:hypothetical protein